jgi:hypothetical protein
MVGSLILAARAGQAISLDDLGQFIVCSLPLSSARDSSESSEGFN